MVGNKWHDFELCYGGEPRRLLFSYSKRKEGGDKQDERDRKNLSIFAFFWLQAPHFCPSSVACGTLVAYKSLLSLRKFHNQGNNYSNTIVCVCVCGNSTPEYISHPADISGPTYTHTHSMIRLRATSLALIRHSFPRLWLCQMSRLTGRVWIANIHLATIVLISLKTKHLQTTQFTCHGKNQALIDIIWLHVIFVSFGKVGSWGDYQSSNDLKTSHCCKLCQRT